MRSFGGHARARGREWGRRERRRRSENALFLRVLAKGIEEQKVEAVEFLVGGQEEGERERGREGIGRRGEEREDLVGERRRRAEGGTRQTGIEGEGRIKTTFQTGCLRYTFLCERV